MLENGGQYAYGVVAHAGKGQYRLGVNAQSGSTLSPGSPTLANYLTVQGDLVCVGTLDDQYGSQVTGETLEGAALPSELPALNLSVDWLPQSSSELVVLPDSSASLASGSYGRVVVNARSDLYLTAGDYQFEHLQFESNSRIHLDTSAGPIRIFVRSNLIHRGTWLPTDPSGASIPIAYLGQNAVAFDASLAATVIAPSTRISLGSGAGHLFKGAFYAGEVEVRPDSQVIHVPFQGRLPLLGSDT